jgi:hypothetical protein
MENQLIARIEDINTRVEMLLRESNISIRQREAIIREYQAEVARELGYREFDKRRLGKDEEV